jgi:hypothetical protein
MNEPPKHTLPEALKIVSAQPKDEPPELWAPGMDQTPPVTPCIGTPVPEGVVIRQPLHPDQKLLALKPLEGCPTAIERQVFDAIWADIEVDRGASEADRDWGFAESPELIAQQQPLPEDIYWLDGIVTEPWCRCFYKTKAGLIKSLLTPHEYPPRLTALGLITRIGFDTLIARQRKIRLEKDRTRKEKDAVKKDADQFPEPIGSPSDASTEQPFHLKQTKSLAESED